MKEAIVKLIETEAAKIADEEVAKAKQNIERRIKERTSEICVVLCQKMSYQSLGQELIITLHIPK